MDLEIKYKNGSMTVHLEEFFNTYSIAKVKKLLKFVRNSFNPECEQQIKEFVHEQVEQFEQVEQVQKNTKNKAFYKKVLENIT